MTDPVRWRAESLFRAKHAYTHGDPWPFRLAWWLRSIADWLTGEQSWSVRIRVEVMGELDYLPDDAKVQIVQAGMDHSKTLLTELTRARLCEVATDEVFAEGSGIRIVFREQ